MKKFFFFLSFLPLFAFAQSIQLGIIGVPLTTNTCTNCISFTTNNNGTVSVYYNGRSIATIPAGNIHASAGVYKVVGADTILKRTLFSCIDVTIGTKPIFWDGKLDNGTPAPNGNYLIKILSNNVTYKWGLIGNSSKSFLNDEQYNAYTDIYDAALTNGNIYYALGYAERDNKTRYAPLNDLGRCIKVDDQGTSVAAFQVDADDNNVYWAGQKDDGNFFVVAYKISGYSQVQFSAGTQIQMDYSGNTYTSAVGVEATPIHGLKVNDNFIFVSRYDAGKLVAYNKVTGAQSYVNNLTNPGNIASTPDGKIWAVAKSGPNFYATLYNVNGPGQLIATNLSIVCDEGSSLSISPTTGELAIVQYSTSQVKIYNGSTGAVNRVIGLAGGYPANGPIITNNKFAFYSYSFAKFGKDGSLWVADNGNRRLLHLTSTGAYIETVASCGINYAVCVDANNPTRVFAGNVEYAVDYTKDLSTTSSNGWVHSKSWLSVVSGDPSNFASFEQVCTFPNGRTYAKVAGDKLYELREGVGVVYLGDGLAGKNIEKDGSLWTRNTGPDYNILKQPVIGYDSNNKPIWGAAQLVVNVAGGVPFNYNNNTLGAASNPGRYFFYNPDYGYVPNNGLEYHLGSIKTSNNTADWQTSLLAPARYSGPFPNNGYYDGSGHSENGRANVVGPNVFWHQNEELGRFTQVCYTNHYNEDGLFIGQFGNDNTKAGLTGDTRFWAGNSFVTFAYAVGGDIYYIHGDESKHAGIHCIKVSNLGSIHEDVIPVALSGTVTPLAASSSDLMAGLPYASDNDAAIANSGTKWTVTRSGATAFQTSVGTFSKDSIDVYCKTYNGSLSVSRALGTVALNSWGLTGKIILTGNDNNNLEILDINGKIIARVNAHYSSIYVNEVLKGNNLTGKATYPNNFSYSYLSSTGLVLNYLGFTTTITSPFENGALLNSPGSLRIIQQSNGGDRVIDVYNLKFTPGNSFAP